MLIRAGALRSRFRAWRRSRPFWAGVWTLLAGVEILSIPLAPLSLMIHEGIAGVSGLLMGVFLVILGLTLWLAPHYRAFAGIATLVFSVASLVLSNFGGFLIGFLLGVIGGAMAVSWVPDGDDGRGRRSRPVPDWGGGGGATGPAAGMPQGGTPARTPDGTPAPAVPPAAPAGGTEPAPPTASGAGSGSGSGSGTVSGSGDDAAGADTAALRSAVRTRAVRNRAVRLRAIGALPVGGALLAGGLQPMAPMAMAHDPGAPRGDGTARSAKGYRSAGEAVCDVLDGLYHARNPTAHGTGSATGKSRNRAPGGLHAGVEAQAPLPVRGSLDVSPGGTPKGAGPGPVPSQRAAPQQPSGGLLGAVGDLLGLRGKQPSAQAPAPRRPGATPYAPPAPRAGGSTRRTRPEVPAPSAGTPPTGLLSGNRISPDSLLDLVVPRRPSDGGMDEPLSLLPARIRLGTPDSPWCLPKVSLELSIGAAGYRDRVTTAEQPFRVLTPLLVLTGLTYHGITAVPTRAGAERVLVFTAWRADIASLRQTAGLLSPACARHHARDWTPPFHGLPGIGLPLLDIGLPGIGRVSPEPPPWAPCQGELESDARPGSTTTATGRPVVLLTRVLSGNLLGLLPVTFTPDMPPPLPPGLTIPIPLFFTQAVAYNQLLTAHRITIPGLHQQASASLR
ncbi:DUF6114 domain-containing protein [Actinacidiphila glaucinigra]|uniref:DUF6114 domain-containing protein n=1 Tax=Actinacidiphila glaucinigra TaxID=235986 RepID=UPI0037C92375